MKVKIPKELQFAGRTYTVNLTENLIRDEGDRGRVLWHTQEIMLARNLQGETRDVTFLHEVIHCIDEHLCGRGGLSESITCALSDGIFQFLKTLGIEFDWSSVEVLDE